MTQTIKVHGNHKHGEGLQPQHTQNSNKRLQWKTLSQYEHSIFVLSIRNFPIPFTSHHRSKPKMYKHNTHTATCFDFKVNLYTLKSVKHSMHAQTNEKKSFTYRSLILLGKIDLPKCPMQLQLTADNFQSPYINTKPTFCRICKY
jgi:hypothetical protein